MGEMLRRVRRKIKRRVSKIANPVEPDAAK